MPSVAEVNMHKKDVLKGRSIVSKNIFDTANQAIDEIKRQNPLVEYFQHRGVVLTKSGSEYKGLCPFHDDHNPSLSVNAEKGVFKCFGCGKAGTVIDAVAFYDTISTGDAIKLLQKTLPQSRSTGRIAPARASIDDQGPRPDERVAIEGDVIPPINETASVAAPRPSSDDEPALRHEGFGVNALTTVAEYYHRLLYQSSDAIEYLKKRGLTRPEIWQRFSIGFALTLSVVEGDGGLLSMISDAQRAELVKIGILHEYENSTGAKTYREHFHNCVIFPIVDDFGSVVGMYGRRVETLTSTPLSEQSHPKQSQGVLPERSRGAHLYLKGKHRGIFNRRASKVYDEIILTESIIDCLSLVELGVENVQPIYGVNGFTDEHLQILKDDRVKMIVIGFDNDEAGIKASEGLRDKLIGEGFAVKIIYPPKSDETGEIKDWNEYLISGGIKDAIAELINSAEIYRSIENSDAAEKFTVTEDQANYYFSSGGVTYRVGNVKDVFISSLRVHIRTECSGGRYYDTADLYSSRSRTSYATGVWKELALEAKRIERDLVRILEYLEDARDRKLRGGSRLQQEMSREEIAAGMELLKSPDIFDVIIRDMETLGYVGEDLNKMLVYLAASSRKLDSPISVLILSGSAAGKSYIVDTVRELLPEEECLSVTSMSEQALNYAEDLNHKFLSLGEAVHSSEVEHQIRELISGKIVSRLVTMKDLKTGKLSSAQVKAPAAVSIVITGTRYDINPENATRFFVVNIDESKEQTKRIHTRQRKKFSLSAIQEKRLAVPEIIRRHQAAQKLLRKIFVVIPYAEVIDFPAHLMRTRRDHDRFLDLIVCVSYLRQYQKVVKMDNGIEYIDSDFEDYETARDILVNGILASTMRELPRGTIDLYDEFRIIAHKLAKKKSVTPVEVSLTQRDIREHTGLGQSWIKMHLRILVEYEYIIMDRAHGRGSRALYRLREDAPIAEIQFSMIPTREELEKKVAGRMKNEHAN